MAANLLPSHNLIQSLSEGIFADDANSKRRTRGAKGVRKPFHELGKVQQKFRFDFVSREACASTDCGKSSPPAAPETISATFKMRFPD